MSRGAILDRFSRVTYIAGLTTGADDTIVGSMIFKNLCDDAFAFGGGR
jgi:hypothetical protein